MDISDKQPGDFLYISNRVTGWNLIEVKNPLTGGYVPVEKPKSMGAGFCPVFTSKEEAELYSGAYGYMTVEITEKPAST